MKRDLLIITAVISSLLIIWFHQGLLFAGAEESLTFYNFERTANLSSSLWYDVGIGQFATFGLSRYPYFFLFSIFQNYGIPNYILQAITFFAVMLIGMLSVYFLLKKTLIDQNLSPYKRVVPLMGSLFYLFNPFSITQIWGRGLEYQIFAFALIPSFLLFFVLGLRSGNFLFGFIGVILSLLLAMSYLHPGIIITSWSLIAIYLIFYLWENRGLQNRLFALFFFFVYLISWAAVHSYWFYPFLNTYSSILNTNLASFDSVQSMIGVSKSSAFFSRVIRLMHREFFDGTYGKYYSFLLLALSWSLPFFLIVGMKILKRAKHFLFFFSLFLISLFLSMGANPPLGFLVVFVFKHVHILQSLRNPYEKYGFNLMLSYSVFFAVGAAYFYQFFTKFLKKRNLGKLKFFLLPFLSFLLFVVLLWPMWNRTFAGGEKVNFWVKVPEYYQQADRWFNGQPGDFRILHLPLLIYGGVRLTWDYPFSGIDPSDYLFTKSSFSRNMFQNGSHYLFLTQVFNPAYAPLAPVSWSENIKDFNNKSLLQEFNELNIKYVVLHRETDPKTEHMPSISEMENILNKFAFIKKVKTIGKLDIYQVEKDSVVDLIYSTEGKVTYKKLSPTNFKLYVPGSQSAVNVYFLNQYDDGWQLTKDRQVINSHFKSFGYANGWIINPRTKGDYIISYKPEKLVKTGENISKFSLGLIALFFVFSIGVKLLKYKRT